LTVGRIALIPSTSPDSRWVVFVSGGSPIGTIWKVSIDGGTPVQVTNQSSYRPVVSPDGKLLACYHATPETASSSQPVYKLTILPIDGGPAVKTFDVGANPTTIDVLQWTPDGRGIFYNWMKDNVSNIWRQPIDGGPPVQVTDFRDMFINDFAWSRDGKLLTCSRSVLIRDAVLITDLK
jgi:Tol biopolymer transport system component